VSYKAVNGGSRPRKEGRKERKEGSELDVRLLSSSCFEVRFKGRVRSLVCRSRVFKVSRDS